jgi:hypothetical protein
MRSICGTRPDGADRDAAARQVETEIVHHDFGSGTTLR